jgi:hypothetical protein
MSGSKRPSATVASFRNNVEEDFTVSTRNAPHSPCPRSTDTTRYSPTIPPRMRLPPAPSPIPQLFIIRCQIQNDVRM